MAKEIERKFLVINDQWQENIQRQSHYLQGYLANSSTSSIRIRISDDKANLNIKSATLDITRDEYDYEIPLSEAKEMLENLCEKPILEKTRYFVQHHGHVWEIDVFSRDNEGLVVAEIELASADEEFIKPRWLGDDVSDDPRYYNVCLVKYPFNRWHEPMPSLFDDGM